MHLLGRVLVVLLLALSPPTVLRAQQTARPDAARSPVDELSSVLSSPKARHTETPYAPVPIDSRPTFLELFGGSLLGGAVLGGLGMAAGKVDISGLWEDDDDLYYDTDPDDEEAFVVPASMLGAWLGGSLGALAVGRLSFERSDALWISFFSAVGSAISYGATSLLDDSDGMQKAGFLVGASAGAAIATSWKLDYERRRARRSLLRVEAGHWSLDWPAARVRPDLSAGRVSLVHVQF